MTSDFKTILSDADLANVEVTHFEEYTPFPNPHFSEMSSSVRQGSASIPNHSQATAQGSIRTSMHSTSNYNI